MKKNTENNKLFGTFLGWKPTDIEVTLIYGGITYYWETGNYYFPDKDNLVLPELFEFDSNWNWLMAVVKKIESLDYYLNWNGKSDYVAITTGEDGGNAIVAFTGKNKGFSKIETIYQAVLKFINWYNEQDR